MKTIKKILGSIIKSVDEKEGTLTALVSTASVDRMDEVLEPAGADLKNYRKNPIVLWAHDYSMPPIGKAVWVKKTKEGILSKVKFATTEFAKEIFELYKEGFMNAFSVGFIPKDSVKGDTEKGEPWRTYTKWEMLEYSAVPVPANPEALSLAIQKGILKSEDVKHALEKGIQKNVEHNEDINTENEEEVFDTVEKALESENNAQVVIDKKEVNGKTEATYLSVDAINEFIAENDLLKEQIKALEKNIESLKYEKYVLITERLKANPGTTVDDVVGKASDIINGVVRKALGKVD